MAWGFTSQNQNGISGNPLKRLHDLISSWKQQVVVNVQYSSWDNATTGVLPGFNLGHLFLIYINDLSNDLSSYCKLFCQWNASFFSGK